MPEYANLAPYMLVAPEGNQMQTPADAVAMRVASDAVAMRVAPDGGPALAQREQVEMDVPQDDVRMNVESDWS